MEDSLSRASFRGKEKSSLPKGAKIISKELSIDVEEIENGFLISKRVEMKYQLPNRDYNDYHSYTKKYFAKDNPLTLNEEVMDDKTSIADKF